MSDTASATVEVLEVTMLPGRRRLMGLAQVEVMLDGVAIVLQGVRILRRADGLSCVEPPCYRHTDGDLVPAVVLPEELEDAVARAVLDRTGATIIYLPVCRPPRAGEDTECWRSRRRRISSTLVLDCWAF